MRPDVGLALAAAACFALSTVAQHRAAVAGQDTGSVPGASCATTPGGVVRGHVALLLRLLRSPLWVAGLVAGVAALLLQALALSRGALVVVQPILLLGLLLALPLSDALARRRPGLGEVLAALAVLVGLAVFLGAAHPDRGVRVAPVGELAAAAGGWTAVAVGAGVLGETLLRRWRALLLGLCGGALIGVASALLKQVVGLVARDGAGALLGPVALAVVLTGVAGVAVTQAGYAAGHLSASQPAHSIAEPAVAAAIGAGAFAEHLATGVLPVAGQLLGALLMAGGVIAIALVVPDLGAGERSRGPGARAGVVAVVRPARVTPPGHPTPEVEHPRPAPDPALVPGRTPEEEPC